MATGVRHLVKETIIKVGTKGLQSAAEDMVIFEGGEEISISVSSNVVRTYELNDTAIWATADMTTKECTISISGSRREGDPGQDYLYSLFNKSGQDAKTKVEITQPNGDKITFNAVVDVNSPFGGSADALDSFSFDLHVDGDMQITEA